MNFMKNSLFQRNLEQEREEEMPEEGGVLAVWGSPSSGKTVVSVKLAEHLAKKKRNVILILADMVTPPLPYLCAPSDIEQERSLGSILAASHVTENLIKKNCMFYRKNDYLSMVGMLKGENVFTYPPYEKEDLIYKALQVDVEREHRYCQKVEEDFLQELNRKKPKSLEEVSRIWYKGVDGRHRHYHESRYHCLNLHSVFQKGTIEFRLFNSTTHAGKIKAYIQLCLAISAQALNQKCASRIKTASTNEKYTFRTWLLRLGMIGDEFKTARKFLLENLEGGIAWKDPEQAVRQKERLRAMKEKKELEIGHAQQADSMEEEVPEDAQGMNMTM